MKKMTGCCGYDCSDCDAFKATQLDDDKERAAVARKWSEKFNAEIGAEQINCDGCRSSDGRLFFYCNMCDIRKCGMEKNVSTCAHCDEYICEKLDAFLQMIPENREILNKIYESL